MFYKKHLISQKYKKCSSAKYALLLYVAVSIKWISIRFDFIQFDQCLNQDKIHEATIP